MRETLKRITYWQYTFAGSDKPVNDYPIQTFEPFVFIKKTIVLKFKCLPKKLLLIWFSLT